MAQVCGLLQDEGSQPDVVIAHSAWGEALELKASWPTTPLIVLPELWGNPQSLGFGFDDALKGERSTQRSSANKISAPSRLF